MRTVLKRYLEPTPQRIKIIGDSILLGCTALTPIIMGSPLNDHSKAWAVTIFSTIGVMGKIISNFFTETPNSVNPPGDGQEN
jgi:hypothetical protein